MTTVSKACILSPNCSNYSDPLLIDKVKVRALKLLKDMAK
jgi:hypothetical protein